MNRNKIDILSQKIEAFFTVKNTYTAYVDNNIFGEDLKYNLTSILIDLMLCAETVQVTKAQIEAVLSDYNNENGTNYTADYFLEKGWLRFINQRFHIATQIGINILYLENPVTFSSNNVELEDDTRALIPVSHLLLAGKIGTFTLTDFEAVVRKHTSEINVDYFLERGIVKKEGNNVYRLSKCEYCRHLRNRIAARGWIKIMGETADLNTLRKFIDFLLQLGYYPDKLNEYLPYPDYIKLTKLSRTLLDSESDLQDNSVEVRNSRLDSDRSQSHGGWKDLPGDLHFTVDDPYLFAKELQFYHWFEADLLLLGGSRSACFTLIRILFDANTPTPYSYVIDLLKSHQNPFIKSWTLFEIKHTYPKVIPYLLADDQLAPLAFLLTKDLQLDQKWVKPDLTSDGRADQASKYIDEVWNDAIDIIIEQMAVSLDYDRYAKILGRILADVATDVFTFNPGNYVGSQKNHQRYRKQYDRLLQILRTQRIQRTAFYPQPAVRLLVLPYLLPGILESVSSKHLQYTVNEFIHFPTWMIDVRIELIRLITASIPDPHQFENLPPVGELTRQLYQEIFDLLKNYFSATEAEITHPYLKREKRMVKRYHTEFAIEIIDFAYLYAHLNKQSHFDDLVTLFKAGINLDTTGDKYTDINKEQIRKLVVFFRTLLLAYIRICEKRLQREFDSLPVEATLTILRVLITDFAKRHRKNDLKNSRVDMFAADEFILTTDPHYVELDTLLYRTVNLFPQDAAVSFINDFFSDSENFGQMISAINSIEDSNIKQLLTDKVNAIDPVAFIQSLRTATELESIIVDTVNSQKLFHLTKPFLEAIEKHIEKRNNTFENQLFVYRVKLLLALKAKDTVAIDNLTPPADRSGGNFPNQQATLEKNFYIGLNLLYNLQDYDRAVEQFKSLHTHHSNRVDFAVYLYVASGQRDAKANTPSHAKADWDNFEELLDDSNREELKRYLDLVQANHMLYYIWEKEDLKMDQLFHSLPPTHLYQHHLIMPIFNRYMERGAPDIAYGFLSKAIDHFQQNGEEVDGAITSLREKSLDEKDLLIVRRTIAMLGSLTAADIPKVLPPALNGKRTLHEFILGEIVNGARVLRHKIKAIESVNYENHYNDLLLATLRLRLPLFGWEVIDQSRSGSSSSGADAGEVDITFRAAGNDIAIVEALKMDGKDFPYLQLHIKKPLEYVRDFTAIYIVVYYYGKRNTYKNFLQSYQSDVLAVSYDPDWIINTTKGFITLNADFTNAENMAIGKTIHGPKEHSIYHIIIDLSQQPVKST